MNRTSLSWHVKKDEAPTLLRTFLREHKHVSKRLLAAVKFKGGKLFVNDEEVTVRKELQAGDLVQMILPTEEKSELLQAEATPIAICYEDADLLIINKPANLATIPSREHPTGTLANAVLAYYETHGLTSTFHAVSRLDRGTSGLLVVAKHRYAHDLLAQLQQRGLLNRTYLAIAEGNVPDCGSITARIGRKQTSLIERMVREDGKKAVTHYQTMIHLNAYSLVELTLETGRTHQIRVHMSHIGHPLVGDELYGGKRAAFGHQALHCHKVSFIHPLINKEIAVQCSIPEEWRSYLKTLASDKSTETTSEP